MIVFEKVDLIFFIRTPLEKVALKDINLRINEGEFVSVIGGNGAGKSSLLNIISGEIKPTAGKIIVNGKDLSTLSLVEKSKIITKVFQDPLVGTFADLTVEENLALAKYKHCKNKFFKALDQKFKDYILEKLQYLPLGLGFNLKDKVRLLSGGQRQILSLLMATLYPGKILLLDEHTAALDPEVTEQVLKFTKNLITENRLTALMITHSMSSALSYGNRILVLKKGQIVKDLNERDKQKIKKEDLLQFFE